MHNFIREDFLLLANKSTLRHRIGIPKVSGSKSPTHSSCLYQQQQDRERGNPEVVNLLIIHKTMNPRSD